MLSRFETFEFGHDQTAGKTRGTGIITFDGRIGAGQNQTTFCLQRLQALKMRGSGLLAQRQTIRDVLANKGIKNVYSSSGAGSGICLER